MTALRFRAGLVTSVNDRPRGQARKFAVGESAIVTTIGRYPEPVNVYVTIATVARKYMTVSYGVGDPRNARRFDAFTGAGDYGAWVWREQEYEAEQLRQAQLRRLISRTAYGWRERLTAVQVDAILATLEAV